MKYAKANIIYFSATGTTATIAKAIGDGVGMEVDKFNITCGIDRAIHIGNDTLAIFAMPVYSGRIPQIAIEYLKKFTGDATPAIVVCVYGNRDFDDALLELKEVVTSCNFRVVSAAAFIARHSIFPVVAADRPDAHDIADAQMFGRHTAELLSVDGKLGELKVKGNYPYRAIASIPLCPKTSRKKCNSCGLCAKQCPAQAINIENPRKIDTTKCLLCAHCIAVCPKGAKHFGGLIYKLAKKSFAQKCAQWKTPYTVFAKPQYGCFLNVSIVVK